MKKLVPILLAAGLIAGCARETSEIVEDGPPPSAPAAEYSDEDAGFAELELRYMNAKADYELDGSSREEYIEAAVTLGSAVMYGPGAPREKYPKALELYAEALDLDPENEEALKNRQMILDIYEQMGRTPPES